MEFLAGLLVVSLVAGVLLAKVIRQRAENERLMDSLAKLRQRAAIDQDTLRAINRTPTIHPERLAQMGDQPWGGDGADDY